MRLRAAVRRRVLLTLYRFVNWLGYDVRKKDTNDLKDLAQLLGLNATPTIFDVGCNQGLMTEKFLGTWPSSAIYAFEPLADVADAATKRFASRDQVQIYNLALCDHNGTIAFNRTAASDSSSLLRANRDSLPPSYKDILATEAVVEVPCASIDAFCKARHIDRIDLLKLDVQGAELAVLKGASELLRDRRIGVIFSEVYFLPFYDGQPLFEDIAEFLQTYGYRFVLPYNLVFGSTTGRVQWGDAIFVAPGIEVPKNEWITNR